MEEFYTKKVYMKNRKGYLLLEGVVCLFVIVTISLSLYSFLYFCNEYKKSTEDKVELYEQGEEMYYQINRIIENSDNVISIKDLNGKTIKGDTPSYIKVNSIKCKYKNEYRMDQKDKEISYKSNHKLFINTLNNSGNSEAGGYEIGDYIDFIEKLENIIHHPEIIHDYWSKQLRLTAMDEHCRQLMQFYEESYI